ncbi:MAG: bifunctional nuclease family protein [Bacteroidetes bacterium]|jgi:bifunctional DNase/RNase|nr:bifunctional nuclease family protein [Bacteroidota bacterium]
MDKKELKILGISAGHTAASYTLILEEIGGNRKLPIVIGASEAQSIAVQIERIKPIRPMTHDLMKAVLDGFGIVLREVVISKLEDSIFYADLVVEQAGDEKIIDARTSDAIGMALRFSCPIYTHEAILREAGIILSDKDSEQLGMGELGPADDMESEPTDEIDDMIEHIENDDLADLSVTELEKMLSDAINEENYDLAARIRDELNNRKG